MYNNICRSYVLQLLDKSIMLALTSNELFGQAVMKTASTSRNKSDIL